MDQSEKTEEVANFFWIGNLSKTEIVCITSFLKAEFKVKLWSYNNLSIPGVESCDASLVLPFEDVTLYKQTHHNGSNETSTAFSDAFRFNLLYKFGGWWFDTDCYCLKSSKDFYELRNNKSFVCGLESKNHPFIGSAAFYADKKHSKLFIDELEKTCLEYNYFFPIWGLIGPRLITKVVHDNKLYDTVLDQSKFYSIGFEDYELFLKEKSSSLAESLISDSYLTHIWHSTSSTKNAEENSLLHKLLFDTYKIKNIKNLNLIQQKKFYSRFVNISYLYHSILNRSPDLEGLHNYISSDLSIDEIKNILLNSNEYKSKLNINNNI
jgi:hypothetical protein